MLPLHCTTALAEYCGKGGLSVHRSSLMNDDTVPCGQRLAYGLVLIDWRLTWLREMELAVVRLNGVTLHLKIPILGDNGGVL